MVAAGPSESSAPQIRCPVCRAVQALSPTCRRCKCDLSLLCAAMAAVEEHRLHCLQELHRGRWPEALQHARQAYDLSANADTARLLAVCHLLCEDWPAALAIAARNAE